MWRVGANRCASRALPAFLFAIPPVQTASLRWPHSQLICKGRSRGEAHCEHLRRRTLPRAKFPSDLVRRGARNEQGPEQEVECDAERPRLQLGYARLARCQPLRQILLRPPAPDSIAPEAVA